MIFRTIQELFNNAIKHSKATKANVTLSLKDEQIELVYFDNGIGIPENINLEAKNQMGLIGIKNQIQSFDGLIRFNSESNKGLDIIAYIPMTGARQTYLNNQLERGGTS